MRKLQIREASVMSEALRQEIVRSEESRYDHRLHGVLMVAQGMNCYEVGRWLGEHSTTVQRWVGSFEAHGFAGLREGERSGRPSRVAPGVLNKLKRELRRDPRSLGYEQTLWDGQLLSHHLQRRHGVRLKVRQCQRLFRQLDFRLRKPRPEIAQADPVRQRAFKKTAPSGS
ncbi:MAG: winged helix-turn-helix domain-containing protein [Gammaproteobacteria bacterium]|nr:winged helix-turn-helix domain-containing protein [Gammaproteobacteria bacterium]